MYFYLFSVLSKVLKFLRFFFFLGRLLVSYKKGFDTVFSELSPFRPAPALPPEGFLVSLYEKTRTAFLSKR